LVDRNILLNIYNKQFQFAHWNLEVQSLFQTDNFQIFEAVDATGSCLFDSMRHIVKSKNNNIKLDGKPKPKDIMGINSYMEAIDDFRSEVISNIENEVTIDGTICSYSFDPRTRNDWMEMEIEEIIKLTKTINEKNRSIKELTNKKDRDEKKKLIKEKDEDWKDFKNKYNLNDANTKKLMSVDTVEKYKEFAKSRYFYGGPIEILTTAELHQINFCIVNATVGTFETYLSKTNSDYYAFMFRNGLHFQPYYKNIDKYRNQFIFKRSEVSETILSLFSANEDEQNFYYKICEEFDKVKTGSNE
jgi:hypothetical protein